MKRSRITGADRRAWRDTRSFMIAAHPSVGDPGRPLVAKGAELRQSAYSGLVRGGDRSLEPRLGARGVGAEFIKDRVLRCGRADVARIDLSVEVCDEVAQSRLRRATTLRRPADAQDRRPHRSPHRAASRRAAGPTFARAAIAALTVRSSSSCSAWIFNPRSRLAAKSCRRCGTARIERELERLRHLRAAVLERDGVVPGTICGPSSESSRPPPEPDGSKPVISVASG